MQFAPRVSVSENLASGVDGEGGDGKNIGGGPVAGGFRGDEIGGFLVIKHGKARKIGNQQRIVLAHDSQKFFGIPGAGGG